MIEKATLVYVTGNKIKFQVASQVMSESGINLIQASLQVPEIQSPQVEEVVKYSVSWASQRLGQPVAVTDAGFYVEVLNGFPGPFIRYVNEWFSAQDYLNLMDGKEDRRVIVRDCLAYCHPAEEPVIYCQTHHGELSVKAGHENGTAMDQLFIPAGCTVPISEMSTDQMIAYWSKTSVWQKLKEYLASKLRKEK